MLIGLVGKKGVGKDFTANYLVKQFGFVQYALANPIKEISKILFMFDDNQLYGHQKYKEADDKNWEIAPRKVYQFLGDMMRTEFQKRFPKMKYKLGNEGFWIHHFKLWYLRNCNKNIVISDVRYQNEADQIKKLGGIIIKITRETEYVDVHRSENQEVKYDYLINNNSTPEKLFNQLGQILDTNEKKITSLKII